MPGMKRTLILAAMTAAVLPAAAVEPADLAKGLADHFRIYLLKPEMRSPQDVVRLTNLPGGGVSAEISYWRSLKSRDPGAEICNAYRWLLLGRGVYGKGAVAAFERFPTLAQVHLTFVDVESGTKLGEKKAEILPTQKVVPYLRVGVHRASLAAKKVDPGSVRSDLDKGRCADVAKKYLDLNWIDRAYAKTAP